MLRMMKTRRVSKSTGGVKFDPFMSLRHLSNDVGADGVTPAWFPISSQKIGGESEMPKGVGGSCINSPFLL